MPRDESKDIVTVMVPMLRKHSTMLREVHKFAQQRDPSIIGDYRVFAAMTFGAFIEQFHKSVMPAPVIQLADQMPSRVVAGIHPASFESSPQRSPFNPPPPIWSR